MAKYSLILDLEFNPTKKTESFSQDLQIKEIIQIGAVILDCETFLEIEHFSSYVHPRENSRITPEVMKCTGISYDDVETAPDFSVVFEMFIDWISPYRNNLKIYQWSYNDKMVMKREVSRKAIADTTGFLKEKWINLQKQFTDSLNTDVKLFSLSKAIEYSGLKFIGNQHDALCDARTTAQLVTLMHEEEKWTDVRRRNDINTYRNSQPTTLGELFDFSKLEVYR